MKVVVTCTIEIAPDRREAALKEAAPLIDMARKEPGCLAYNWGADLCDDKLVHVHEEWASQEAFATHLTAPSFFGMSDHLAKFGLLGATARKFLAQADSPIYDQQGNVRDDFFEE